MGPDDDNVAMNLCRLSRLSIQGRDADVDVDADEELSDEVEGKQVKGLLSWSDSDKEQEGCCSLPTTPPQWRRRRQVMKVEKENASSDNEASMVGRKAGRKWSSRRIKRRYTAEEEEKEVVGMTRPKGGRRAMKMDKDEVKACRDLGLELGDVATCYTSSGGNSPISTWRISSPGDDPRDVKARLKVWAQAVALASTSSSQAST